MTKAVKQAADRLPAMESVTYFAIILMNMADDNTKVKEGKVYNYETQQKASGRNYLNIKTKLVMMARSNINRLLNSGEAPGNAAVQQS